MVMTVHRCIFISFYSYLRRLSDQLEIEQGGVFIVKDEGGPGNGPRGPNVCFCSLVACGLG